MKLDEFPKIVVTTNVCSQTVYDYLHQNNVDFIFYKKQQNERNNGIQSNVTSLLDYGDITIFDDTNTKIQNKYTNTIYKNS